MHTLQPQWVIDKVQRGTQAPFPLKSKTKQRTESSENMSSILQDKTCHLEKQIAKWVN